jgi:hypothetical protein
MQPSTKQFLALKHRKRRKWGAVATLCAIWDYIFCKGARANLTFRFEKAKLPFSISQNFQPIISTDRIRREMDAVEIQGSTTAEIKRYWWGLLNDNPTLNLGRAQTQLHGIWLLYLT